jgi:hypothetical protein
MKYLLIPAALLAVAVATPDALAQNKGKDKSRTEQLAAEGDEAAEALNERGNARKDKRARELRNSGESLDSEYDIEHAEEAARHADMADIDKGHGHSRGNERSEEMRERRDERKRIKDEYRADRPDKDKDHDDHDDDDAWEAGDEAGDKDLASADDAAKKGKKPWYKFWQ